MNTGQNPVRGRVVTASDLPRSYVVSTSTGEVRRNRSHLTIVPPTEEAPTEEAPTKIGPVPEAISPNWNHSIYPNLPEILAD